MQPFRKGAVLAVLLALLVPAVAAGHAERATLYPDHAVGAVPKYRSKGPKLVVCKKDSAQRTAVAFRGRSPKQKRLRKLRLRLVKQCKFEHIQAAVNAAKSGDRILVMPGIYREEPSRAIPVKDPKCAGDQYWESSGDNHQADGRVPTYLHQVDCPNARNLIAVIGDSTSDEDRTCDQKCNLQMEGMGRAPSDVVVQGDRLKPDVIRADRADGFQLINMTVEQGAYNSIDVVETNGFRLDRLVAAYGSHYGILTFTSDHGLYEDIDAYGNGDSGVYPGSGPETHCKDYGIEMRDVDSHGNLLGASGTAGNGTWTHDSRFHDNGAGISNDSFAPGHPGMPQDCSKWERNDVSSNNWNLFEPDHQAACNATPFENRPKDMVCPAFQAVIGVGFMLYGVNDNLFRDNRIWDQWRNGVRLFAAPAPTRGENDPAKLYDTSHHNTFTQNVFGVRPDGTPDRNRIDVYWDEQGIGNCWEDNQTAPGRPLTSDPGSLPTCASGGSNSLTGNTAKLAAEIPCINWNPKTNPNPPGCSWMTDPGDPGDAGAARAARSRASTLTAPSPSVGSPIAWAGAPQLVRPGEAPHARIVAGQLQNASVAPVELDADTARLIDDGGRPIQGEVSFASGFSHGLYSPAMGPKEAMPAFEALRLGRLARIAAGESVPFTVSWRSVPGARAPARVDFGTVSIALPA